MANPILNTRTINESILSARGASTSEYMTTGGTLFASGSLFMLLLAASLFGWKTVAANSEGLFQTPGWLLPGILLGFALTFVIRFKPTAAMFVAPVYAVVEGLVVGVISHVYNVVYHGVVAQAVFATIATLGAMVFLYRTGIIKVTQRFRLVIGAATMGLMALYGISILLSLFHVNTPIIHDATPLGILFSVVAAGLAAMNLAIDFDMIERGIKGQAPKYMEWVGAFGLLVTVVWLYLEILRLLGKMQRR